MKLPSITALLIGLFNALSVQAAVPSYKIDVEYLSPGNEVRSGSAVVKEKESGKLQLTDTLVRFLPYSVENGGIKINALVVRRTGTSDQIIAQPSVIVKDGVMAETSELDENGKLLYKLRFTARSN